MRISGVGISVVTALKIQQFTRARLVPAQIVTPTPVAPIRDLLDLSPAARSNSVGAARAFYRGVIRLSR